MKFFLTTSLSLMVSLYFSTIYAAEIDSLQEKTSKIIATKLDSLTQNKQPHEITYLFDNFFKKEKSNEGKFSYVAPPAFFLHLFKYVSDETFSALLKWAECDREENYQRSFHQAILNSIALINKRKIEVKKSSNSLVALVKNKSELNFDKYSVYLKRFSLNTYMFNKKDLETTSKSNVESMRVINSNADAFEELFSEFSPNWTFLNNLWVGFIYLDRVGGILGKFLEYNTSLTSLELVYIFINLEDLKMLTEGLKKNKTLIYLTLVKNEIKEEGAKELATFLESNSTLKDLDFSENRINEEGGIAIAEALKSNTTLTSLWLNQNHIGDEGIKKLSITLETNSSITYLNLMSNSIDLNGEGAKSLAGALKKNDVLKILDLGWNKISPGGQKAIAEALEINKNLTYLDMMSNDIEDEGAEWISNALRSNSSLKSLRLSHNGITKNGAMMLAEVIVKRIPLMPLCLSFSVYINKEEQKEIQKKFPTLTISY